MWQCHHFTTSFGSENEFLQLKCKSSYFVKHNEIKTPTKERNPRQIIWGPVVTQIRSEEDISSAGQHRLTVEAEGTAVGLREAGETQQNPKNRHPEGKHLNWGQIQSRTPTPQKCSEHPDTRVHISGTQRRDVCQDFTY